MPISRRAKACILGGVIFALSPSNYVAYKSVHSSLHSGQTKEQIEEKMDQLRYGSDFLVSHPFAAGSSRPFYYLKVWPGKQAAYIRHSLE